MKRNRKKVLVTISLVLAFIFTCSSLSLFAEEISHTQQTGASISNFGVLIPETTINEVVLSGALHAANTQSYSWEFSHNSYFNDHKTRPCQRCHGEVIKCDSNGTCECISRNNSIQCCGYAQVVFKALAGYFPTEGAANDVTESYKKENIGISDVTKLRSLHTPIYLNLRGHNNSTDEYWGHYICVIEMSDDGLVFCDANGFDRAGYCQVKNEVYISYSNFVARYYAITEVIEAGSCFNHNYTITSKNANYHIYTCLACRDLYTENHNMVGNYCTECLQVNTHTSTAWKKDLTYHWKVCTDCNDLQITNKQVHDYGLSGLICECGARNISINKISGSQELQ